MYISSRGGRISSVRVYAPGALSLTQSLLCKRHTRVRVEKDQE